MPHTQSISRRSSQLNEYQEKDDESFQAANSLKEIEFAMRANLAEFENVRKLCAYCGSRESGENVFGRCYGCQMVYYCSQEHQNLDWLNNHMPKCAELEWVALGELIRSIPASPVLTKLGQFWPENFVPFTWTDWFNIRSDLVNIAKQTAKVLEKNFFSANSLKMLNRREPTYNDLVDGLLAAVTDSITYALTIGFSLNKLQLEPEKQPISIHILNPPEHLLNDLGFLFNNENLTYDENERALVSEIIKKKFNELCNMYRLNKGFEIVFISENTMLDVKVNDKWFSVDWARLFNAPFMKSEQSKEIFISGWNGKYSNYVKCRRFAKPDLVVSFQPSFTQSPQQLINEWTDDLKVILTNELPCLFTFYDKDEGQKAFNILNAFQARFLCVQTNQFGSLMLKQAVNKTNMVHAANSVLILIKGFEAGENLSLANTTTTTTSFIKQSLHEQFSVKLNESSLKQNKSIKELLINLSTAKHLNQSDACIQTVGLQEPENLSLRHFNGKLQINKQLNQLETNQEMMERAWSHHQHNHSSPAPRNYSYKQNEIFSASSSSSQIYNKLVDVYIDTDERIKQQQQQFLYYQQTHSTSNMPLLDFSSRLSHLKSPKLSSIELNNRGINNYRPIVKLTNNSQNYESPFQLVNQPVFNDDNQNEANIYQTIRDDDYLRMTVKNDDSMTLQQQKVKRARGNIETPSTKPRNRSLNYEVMNKEVSVYQEIARPTVKPRGRHGQGNTGDKYCNEYTPISEIMRHPNNSEKPNPMPKQRNSVHYSRTEVKNVENCDNTNNNENLVDNNNNNNNNNEDDEKLVSSHHNNQQEKFDEVFLEPVKKNIELSYFKTSLIKSRDLNEETIKDVNENQLKTLLNSSKNRSESSSSSPSSSSSSVISSSSSPEIISSSSISSHSQPKPARTSTKPAELNLNNAGFVNQMRNIFEHHTKKNSESLKKPETNTSAVEYMNVNEPFLTALQNDLYPSRPSTPPPVPTSSPPRSRSPSPTNNDQNNITLTTTITTTTTTTTIATKATKPSEFRILDVASANQPATTSSERSSTPSSKSLGSSLNLANSQLMIGHVPDSVDMVKLEYEGERKIVVPGYLTSADILRNMLLKNQNLNATSSIQPQLDIGKLSLKEKLILQQKKQEEDGRRVSNESDDEFEKKFKKSRARSRSMSVTLDLPSTEIIDIDLDYEDSPRVDVEKKHEEKRPSIRLNKLIKDTNNNSNSSKRSIGYLKQTVTGSFDPSDFDSFDEGDEEADEKAHIPIESFEKILEEGILQQELEQERIKQEENLVQFDPSDFDSFDEDDEVEDLPRIVMKRDDEHESIASQVFINAVLNKNVKPVDVEEQQVEPVEIIDIKEQPKLDTVVTKTDTTQKSRSRSHSNYLTDVSGKISDAVETIVAPIEASSSRQTSSSNFIRSALDRISQRSNSKSSSKSRSQSVPLKTLVNSQNLDAPENCAEAKTSANMKTVHLMAKMQAEHEQKQKRRHLRQLNEEQKSLSKSTSELKTSVDLKSPKGDRKFLSSIMNSLFSTNEASSTNSSSSSSNNETNFQKNEAKRLSLRKLKAKDKLKKKPDERLSTVDGESDDESNAKKNITVKETSAEPDRLKKFIKSPSFDGSCTSLAQFQTNFKPTSIGVSSISTRFGKIKNEKDKPINDNNKENLMKKLKAELAEEIKDRQMLEMKQSIINSGSTSSSTSSKSSEYDNLERSSTLNRKSLKDAGKNESNRKIRSKSVTFLDELSADEGKIGKSQKSNGNLSNCGTVVLTTPGSSKKSLKTGDVRLMCGALTGVGPIRGIMKKSATDLSITLNSPLLNKGLGDSPENRLPKLQLKMPQFDDTNYIEAIQQINRAKKNKETLNFAVSDL